MKTFYFILFVIFIIFEYVAAFSGAIQYEIISATLAICMFIAVLGEDIIEKIKK